MASLFATLSLAACPITEEERDRDGFGKRDGEEEDGGGDEQKCETSRGDSVRCLEM